MKYPKDRVEQNLARLHELLKPGDTVVCVLRSVAKSGMSRRIDFYTADLAYLTHSIAVVLGDAEPKNGLRVDGCGMDMGFSVVYSLGDTLWPKGTDVPHGTRNGEPDSAGGYAIKHRWL
jgi:hypothetical protein